MNFSIDQFDKKDFKCFKLYAIKKQVQKVQVGDKNNTSSHHSSIQQQTQQQQETMKSMQDESNYQIYFGQIQYVNQSDGQVVTEFDYLQYLQELEKEKVRVQQLKEQQAQQKDKVDPKKKIAKEMEKTIVQDQVAEIEIDHIIMQRHGVGVQIYVRDGIIVSQYEGYWKNDKREGHGKTIYEDKSEFHGQIINEQENDYGRYFWENGNIYEGIWKNGRLDGAGQFKHSDGNQLVGQFKNNQYMKSHDMFVNPFMNYKQILDFIQNKRYINKIKERNYSKKLFVCEKVQVLDYKKVKELINKSSSNNRVPLILSSKELQFKKSELLKYLLIENPGKQNREFDLRQAYCSQLQSQDKLEEYLNQTKNNLADSLIKGYNFIINIDDSQVEYDEIFDPDISKFYHQNKFPSQVFNYKDLTKQNIFENVINGIYKGHQKPNQQFIIIVWSKFKISQNCSLQQLEEKFRQRFGSVVPVGNLDVILLCEKEEIKQDVKVN